MLKLLGILGFFVLFTTLLWALGLGPHAKEPVIEYLVFAAQLLYGSMCYDLLKSLKQIPSDDDFWSKVWRPVGEASAWMIFSIFLLLIAVSVPISVPIFAYVGLAGSFISYGFIFVRVLPRLHPIYVEAQNRAPNHRS